MKIFNFKLILLWFLLIPKSLTNNINIETSKLNLEAVDRFTVLFLKANSTFNFKPLKRGFFEKHLNTYCYLGEPKTLGRLLETIELQLEIGEEGYTQYDGTTPEEVEKHYTEHRSIFSMNLFSQKRSRVLLSPFSQQCIGIETVQPYNVTLYRENIDYYRSIQLLSGILMFLFSGILSTNSLFYYFTGIIFGICSSFLLLIWLSGKLMPKRTMMYGVLIGGWTVGFYIIRMLWDNIQMITMTYRKYVCWYIIITGIISFFFCYRWGPPKNRRSKNIIKWLLQLMSLAMIYFSSNFKEASLAIILITIILYYFPRAFNQIITLRANTSKDYLSHKKVYMNARVKDLRDDVNKIKDKSLHLLQNNSEYNYGIKFTHHEVVKRKMDNSELCNEDSPSDSDISLGEQDLNKQKLYPLPDGSFLLSEKPPIILTPRRAAPLYHRSTPAFSNDNLAELVYTPKNQQSYVPLAAQSRRLSAAASTSDLLKRCSQATPSPSKLQRSSSAQSHSSNMRSSVRKNHFNTPKIKIENPSSDNESLI